MSRPLGGLRARRDGAARATLRAGTWRRRLQAPGVAAVATIALAAAASPAAAQSTPCALNAVCEAETGTLHDGAGTENEHAGYTGTGFVDQLIGNAGVVLRVNAAEAGTHRVTVRYANANPGTGIASRRFTLTVNGTTHVPVLFPVTASWSTWSTVTVLVPLTAGTNTARLPHRSRQQRADQHRPHRRRTRHRRSPSRA